MQKYHFYLEFQNKSLTFASNLSKLMKQERDEGYSHVLKYTGIFGGVQGLMILIGLVRNKGVALLLGADGMGLASLLTSVQNFASQCTNLGVSFGAVPTLSELYSKDDQQQLSRFIQTVRLWSVIAAGLGFVFCLAMSRFADTMTFTWGNHTLHYAVLALSVAMLAITGGETAILKATRRLGSLAKIQLATAFLSLIISLPLYYFLYQSGVIPVIVLMALTTMVATVVYSYHYYPLQLDFNKSMLRDGAGMIRLGVAFIMAAIMGSGAEMLIRAFLNVDGGLNDVGLYNAAYMITMTYAGMVFTAMESDYFPRLSAVHQDISATNETVNKQMEVSLLLLSPMLTGLIMLLPLLIPLLFSNEFIPVVSMAQVAVLAMFFKVQTLPVAYITLARSLSMSYLLLESVYNVVYVLCVIAGYHYYGLYGTGVAIVLAHVFDYFLINGYAYWQYGYRSTMQVRRYGLIQTVLGLAAFGVSLSISGWAYWIAEAALTIVSTAYSVHILRQKTHLWESLKRRFVKTT